MLKLKITAASLKSEYPEVYSEVKQEIETQMSAQVTDLTAKVTDLNSKVTTLSTENSRLKADVAIRTNAAKLNLPTYGEALIAEGKSVEESLTLLITQLSAKGPETNVLGNVLRETASTPAGQGSKGDTTEPKTYDEAKAAMKLMKPELSGSKLAAATRKQFPNVILKMSQTEE